MASEETYSQEQWLEHRDCKLPPDHMQKPKLAAKDVGLWVFKLLKDMQKMSDMGIQAVKSHAKDVRYGYSSC